MTASKIQSFWYQIVLTWYTVRNKIESQEENVSHLMIFFLCLELIFKPHKTESISPILPLGITCFEWYNCSWRSQARVNAFLAALPDLLWHWSVSSIEADLSAQTKLSDDCLLARCCQTALPPATHRGALAFDSYHWLWIRQWTIQNPNPMIIFLESKITWL